MLAAVGVWPYLSNLALGSIVLNDRHGVIRIRPEPLLDTLDVIVLPSTGLAALEEASEHDLLGCGEEEHFGRETDL